jgi:tripartite ATP-independent transporter DctM subunit
MPIIVLGGIYSGIFTAIESASVGTVYGALICIHRLKAQDWIEILEETALYTAVLFWVIKPAVVFSQGLSMAYIPQQMTESIVSAGVGATGFILIMTAFYLFMGCFVDGVAMLVLTVPVILTILETLKIDLIWYNIIFILNAEMGCITPPFGVNIFILMSLMKGTDIGEVWKGVWPFLLAMLICLLLVIIFPPLATWLPSRMG